MQSPAFNASSKNIDLGSKFKTPMSSAATTINSRAVSPATVIKKREQERKKDRYASVDKAGTGGPFYSNLDMSGKIMSKWNMNLADSLASKKAKLSTMN